MKRIISLLLAVVMLVGCVAVLAGCGAPADEGAQIAVYLGDQLLDFDPSDYYVNSNAEQLYTLLYEPLFKLKENGDLDYAAAKRYEIDEYERTITIELRETYWSDDTRVRAADFVYALRERLLNPSVPNPAAALLYGIENAAAAKTGDCSTSDVGIVATDAYELVITYRRGVEPESVLKNLASVATSPIRQDVAGLDSSSTSWSKSLSTMKFNGPFEIRGVNYETGELTLARNLGYHQDPKVEDYDNNVVPAVLAATFTVAGQPVAVSYDDIAEKTVFIMTDASLADRKANKGSATVADDTSVYTYVFNTNNPVLSDARVRRALSMAIDREAIIEAITFGKAADGFLPDISGGSSANLITTSASLGEAKAIIRGVDFGSNAKALTLAVADNEESRAIADIVVAAWSQLGFTVTVEYLGIVESIIGNPNNPESENNITVYDSGIQYAVKDTAFGNGTYDVIALDWQLYSTDPFVGLAALSSSMNGNGTSFPDNVNRSNLANWYNSDYDRLILDAYNASGSERAELLKDAESILVDEAPICPLVFNQSFVFTGSEISDVKIDGLGSFVFSQVKLENYQLYLPPEEEGEVEDDVEPEGEPVTE